MSSRGMTPFSTSHRVSVIWSPASKPADIPEYVVTITDSFQPNNITSDLPGQVLPLLHGLRGDVPDAPDPEELGVDDGRDDGVEHQDQN